MSDLYQSHLKAIWASGTDEALDAACKAINRDKARLNASELYYLAETGKAHRAAIALRRDWDSDPAAALPPAFDPAPAGRGEE